MQSNHPNSPALEGTSTYPLDKLISLWKSGRLTSEQMCGHLLQHLILLERRVTLLTKPSPQAGTPLIVNYRPAPE